MEISSLSKLCLESVADNIAMWCQSAIKEDFYQYLYTIGPFNLLNSKLIQELLDICYDKQVLKASYFPLLFLENFTMLDLSRCHSLITDQVLKFACLRCKKLTHLNLNGCSRLSSSCLNDSLPTLKFLKSLRLSKCRGCSDQLLHKLGNHCRNLQELVVNLCPKVTDVGIEALCTKYNPNEVGCFGIVHLDVTATSVTTKSLERILLGLPKLRKLCFSDVSGETDLGFVAIPLLRIVHLDLFGTFLVNSDLKLLIDNCPELTELRLNLSSMLNKIVTNHLPLLSHLKSLDLGGASDGILFDDVETFLKRRGDQLESLNLSGLNDVCISVLCTYCKSLKELILAHCQNVDLTLPAIGDLTRERKASEQHHGGRFSDFCTQLFSIDLSFTTFHDNGHPELHSVLVCGILSDHRNLRTLSLKNVDVNDEILEQMCGSLSSLALNTLYLTNCNAISIQSISSVVERCRNLRLLDLSHCKYINLGFVSQMKKRLMENRSRLQITWV